MNPIQPLIFSAVIFLSQGSQAATPYKQTLSVKKNAYASDGVFIGGKAGAGTSLLNVRRIFSPKAQLERVVLDLGDRRVRVILDGHHNPAGYQQPVRATGTMRL